MNETKLPYKWDEERVQRVISHYEQQSEEEAVAEDEEILISILSEERHGTET